MRGRPAFPAVLAFDVGGTVVKACALGPTLTELAGTRVSTPPPEGGEQAIVATIGEVTERLCEQVSDLGYEPLGLGLAIPGVVDEPGGMSVFAANLGWRDVPIRDLVAARTGLPVALGHDVRAGCLAEASLGAAAGVQDVVFVPIGTGIAAAMVDGRLLVAGGYAGELGHVVVVPNGEACNCGQRGCLETVGSVAAILRRYNARADTPLTAADHVAARVVAGDPHAMRVWREAIDALADGLMTVVTLLGPEVVAVGGGLAEAGELLLDPLRQALDGRLTFQRRPRVVPAALGDRAGCLGAGLLGWNQREGEYHEGTSL